MRKFNGRMVGQSRKKVFVRESRKDTNDSAAWEEEGKREEEKEK